MHRPLPDFAALYRCIQPQMIPARLAIRPLHSTEITRSLHWRFDRRNPGTIRRRPGGCEADTPPPEREGGMRSFSATSWSQPASPRCSSLIAKTRAKSVVGARSWISCYMLLCKAKVKYERRLKRKRFDRNGQGPGGAGEPIPK